MQPRPSASARGLVLAFTLTLAGAIGVLFLSWQASLLDRYEFRQLQTALSTFWIASEGWKLDYPLPLFGPPWSVPMEFPIYQTLVAWLHNLTGCGLEQSGRLVSISFLLCSLPAIYDLLGITGLSRSRRLIVMIFIITCPVYLFYARTFMIETTALCFSVWFLASLRRGLVAFHPGWLVLTLCFATAAALTKITTFIVFGIPAAALVLSQTVFARTVPSRTRVLKLCLSAGIAALSFFIAWAWFRHGDAVKDSNPFTGFLTARELQDWNFGPLSLRTDWSFWIKIQEVISGYILADGALAIGLICTAFATKNIRWVAGLCLAGFFSGPLVFANLYHIHDYYYAANAIFLVGAAGLLLASAWDNPRLPAGLNWSMLLLVLIFQGYAFYRGYYSHHRNPAPPPPEIAAIIREEVPADGVLLIFGDDWNPLIPYYSERRAVMVPGRRENESQIIDAVIANLPPHRLAAMLITGPVLQSEEDFPDTQAARFGFSVEPAAVKNGYALYLPKSNAAPTIATPNPAPPADSHERFIGTENTLTPEQFPMCTPAPLRARSQFGVQPGMIDNQMVVLAHAFSELIFFPPPGARKIHAEVGLAPNAYANSLPEATDGVVVQLFEETPETGRRLLLSRALNPSTDAADRGPQTLSYTQHEEFTGELIFLISPGPDGNNAYDQAYWKHILID
ncbi:MAG: hypothetical protein R3F03_15245 [Opitutaceae bacterium]